MGEVQGKEGFDLFGGKPLSQDELSKQLQGFLGEQPDKPDKPDKPDRTDRTDKADEAEPEAEEAEGEVKPEPEPEGDAEGEGEEEESEPEEDATDEDEEPVNGKWPKSAIAAISEVRKAKRELAQELEEARARLTELESERESLELKRPLPSTPESPLAFITDEEGLAKWVRETKQTQRLIEDFLDDTLDEEGSRALKAWAKNTGNLTEDGELNPAGLKRFKRLAEDALTDYVPQRAQQLKQERAASAIAEKHFPEVWGKRGGQAYKDAMEVVRVMPWIRSLPHWKVAATVYALGMPAFRERVQGVQGKGKAKPVQRTVSTPGRVAALPRKDGNASGQAAREQLRRKAFSKEGTAEDVQEYLKAQLMGQL